MERAIQTFVLLALLGLAAAAPEPAARSGDHSGGWGRVTKPSKDFRTCIRKARSCRAVARCAKYSPCDRCDYASMAPRRCTPLPSAWSVLSRNPDLSIAASFIENMGLASVFNGSFTGTMLMPSNAAMTAWMSTMAVNPAERMDYMQNFLVSMLQYHILLNGVFATQLRSTAYSTAYMSINAIPHKVTAVYNGTCSAVPDKVGGRGCTRSFYLRDEQGFDIKILGVDALVLGGGVVHMIDSVLQPSDVYPSCLVMLKRKPELFSSLLGVIVAADEALAPYNISVVTTLETNPGSKALPANPAFVGLDLSGISLQYLTQTLLYHFCPADTPEAIIRTPYAKKDGINPCSTLLNAFNDMVLPTGLGFDYQPVSGGPANMSVTYLAGDALSGEFTTERATILMADIKMPISSAAAIDKLMLAPTGLSKPALP